ncbi:MAG: hypothetical protein IIA40_08190 [SAR324 cluster bacterium]|nr:hypothetical protein [SAR324 cluster bacterium]
MVDITNATVSGYYAALITHPGYYYLYALYFDYPINNAWFKRREYAALIQERLRTIQPLLALVQPYRKSPALRLFTERESRDRFPPERVNEAWRQLRNLIERVGPPPGWPDGPPPPEPTYRWRLPRAARKRNRHGNAGIPVEPESAAKARAAYLPQSPVDYTQDG